MPLVVKVNSADIMATLLNLKREFEDINGNNLRLTFSGAAEAHLLAEEIATAGISVILTSPRPYPYTWEQRRMSVFFVPLSRQISETFGDYLDYPVLHFLSIILLAHCWLKASM